MPPFPLIARLAAALLALVPARAPQSELLVRRVLLSGDPAPGAGPGVVFAGFGALPGAGDDFAPRIDARGELAFHAVLAGPGVTGVALADGNGLGLWRALGPASGVARQDELAPGTTAEFQGFLSALDTRPPTISAGHVAFLGGLRGPGVDATFGTNAAGLWSADAHGARLVARAGDGAPGLPAGHVFRLLDAPLLGPGGRVLFDALWRAPGDSPGLLAPNQEGFWSDRSGVLAAVVLAGAAAPGTAAGTVFRQATSTAVEGAFRGWDADEQLRLVVNGNLGGPGVDDLDDEGVWAERAAGLELLAREGAPAPGAGTGVRFGIPNGIDTFGEVLPVRRSAGGAVFFGARLSGPGVPFLRSLWSDRSGALAPIARATLPLSGSAAGDPAPGFGPGWTFSVLALYDCDAAGRVALSGFATFQLDFDQQEAGLWRERGAGLELVARAGERAPGTPAGVVFSDLNRFLSLTDAGTLFFLAGLAGPGVDGSDDLGLFAADAGGRLRLVVREGAGLDVGAGATRTVAAIVPGDAGAADGLAFELGFSDGSSGLFSARFAGGPHLRRR